MTEPAVRQTNAAPEAAGVLHVLFRVDDSEYVVPAADVLQLESFTSTTKVPGAPPYVRGLAQIRGKVVPVIDLRARFGLPPIEPTLDTRIILLSHGTRTVGLLADTAREVVRIAKEEVHAPSDVLSAHGGGFVQSIARSGRRILMVLDMEKLIGEGHIDGQ